MNLLFIWEFTSLNSQILTIVNINIKELYSFYYQPSYITKTAAIESVIYAISSLI